MKSALTRPVPQQPVVKALRDAAASPDSDGMVAISAAELVEAANRFEINQDR